jgi:hypothetical protein
MQSLSETKEVLRCDLVKAICSENIKQVEEYAKALVSEFGSGALNFKVDIGRCRAALRGPAGSNRQIRTRVDYVFHWCPEDRSPLGIAVDLNLSEIVDTLCSFPGVDVNYQDSSEFPILISALPIGHHIQLGRLPVTRGADRDELANVTYQKSAEDAHNMVRILLRHGANVNAKTTREQNVRLWGCDGDPDGECDRLEDSNVPEGSTVLHVLLCLIRSITRPSHTVDGVAREVSMSQKRREYMSLEVERIKEYLFLIRTLMGEGGDPNILDSHEMSPFILALAQPSVAALVMLGGLCKDGFGLGKVIQSSISSDNWMRKKDWIMLEGVTCGGGGATAPSKWIEVDINGSPGHDQDYTKPLCLRPLYYAALNGLTSVVQELIYRGADVGKWLVWGGSPQTAVAVTKRIKEALYDVGSPGLTSLTLRSLNPFRIPNEGPPFPPILWGCGDRRESLELLLKCHLAWNNRLSPREMLIDLQIAGMPNASDMSQFTMQRWGMLAKVGEGGIDFGLQEPEFWSNLSGQLTANRLAEVASARGVYLPHPERSLTQDESENGLTLEQIVWDEERRAAILRVEEGEAWIAEDDDMQEIKFSQETVDDTVDDTSERMCPKNFPVCSESDGQCYKKMAGPLEENPDRQWFSYLGTRCKNDYAMTTSAQDADKYDRLAASRDPHGEGLKAHLLGPRAAGGGAYKNKSKKYKSKKYKSKKYRSKKYKSKKYKSKKYKSKKYKSKKYRSRKRKTRMR